MCFGDSQLQLRLGKEEEWLSTELTWCTVTVMCLDFRRSPLNDTAFPQ